MSAPDEYREGVAPARRALAESRAREAHTEAVVADAQQTFRLIRAHREQNHYADKFRAILRGSH